MCHENNMHHLKKVGHGTGDGYQLSYISAFDPSADKKRNLASKIYDISESVTKFFWDDAPRLGIQQREGQQDMAFDVLDAIKAAVML